MAGTVHDLLGLEPEAREQILASLTPAEAEVLWYDWEFWGRPNQLPPEGDWLVWVVQAGRGFGKTRIGAEFVKDRAWRRHPDSRVALVADTFGEGRDVMVEGESGLLRFLPPSALRGGSVSSAWNRSMGELYLENGSRFDIYSAEKPGQLRGPQHHFAWCDELAKWRDAGKGDAEDTTWSNLLLGLRLGEHPQCVVTTTPRRVKLLVGTKERPGVLKQPYTIVTRGSTYDNLINLAPSFRTQILRKYKGTRLERQEIFGEILEDVEGALFTQTIIESYRRAGLPIEEAVSVLDLVRVVVGVDPAVSSGEEANETGIVIAGKAADGHAYVLGDRSIQGVTPLEWGRRVIKAYDDAVADRIVPEVNNGGELVETVLHTIRPRVPVKAVHASRGKRTRAEPVAALYGQGLIHHVGLFADLEDQMTTWVPDEDPDSPDRLDALVWAITDLMISPAQGRARGRAKDTRLRGRR